MEKYRSTTTAAPAMATDSPDTSTECTESTSARANVTRHESQLGGFQEGIAVSESPWTMTLWTSCAVGPIQI